MSGFKKERVAELLLSFLAEEVRRLDDPRLLLVSLTAVDISPDLKTARVYWTVMSFPTAGAATESVPLVTDGNGTERPGEEPGPEAFYPPEQQVREVEEAFSHIVSHLKRRVASELKLRYTPQLQFRYDHSIAEASRIEYLVRKVGA